MCMRINFNFQWLFNATCTPLHLWLDKFLKAALCSFMQFHDTLYEQLTRTCACYDYVHWFIPPWKLSNNGLSCIFLIILVKNWGWGGTLIILSISKLKFPKCWRFCFWHHSGLDIFCCCIGISPVIRGINLIPDRNIYAFLFSLRFQWFYFIFQHCGGWWLLPRHKLCWWISAINLTGIDISRSHHLVQDRCWRDWYSLIHLGRNLLPNTRTMSLWNRRNFGRRRVWGLLQGGTWHRWPTVLNLQITWMNLS